MEAPGPLGKSARFAVTRWYKHDPASSDAQHVGNLPRSRLAGDEQGVLGKLGTSECNVGESETRAGPWIPHDADIRDGCQLPRELENLQRCRVTRKKVTIVRIRAHIIVGAVGWEAAAEHDVAARCADEVNDRRVHDADRLRWPGRSAREAVGPARKADGTALRCKRSLTQPRAHARSR